MTHTLNFVQIKNIFQTIIIFVFIILHMINKCRKRNLNSEDKDNAIIMYIVEKWKKKNRLK